MSPRYLLVAVFFVSLIGGAAAKEKNGKVATTARTWKDIQDHAWKTGDEWPIKPPMSRNLGYTTDEVKAKGVSLDQAKSKDNRTHGVVVVYEVDKAGVSKPLEFVLGTMRVTETKDGKAIDGYRLRMTLKGEPLKMMHSTGLVGHVEQNPIALDSKSAREFFKNEKQLFLNDIDLKQLIP